MKWMLVFIFSLLFSFYAKSEEMRLSNTNMDQLLGKEWKGILFVCDPYCRFIAIRESTSWNPILNDETVDPKTIKSIAETDPIYPLLIVQSPVFPFISQRLKNSKGLKKNADVTNSAPSYASAPFNFGWYLGLGPKISSTKIQSDTSVQAELSPSGMISGGVLEAGLMKGSPSHIWKFWVQHVLQASMDVAGSYQTEDDIAVTTAGMEVKYQAWLVSPTMKNGPRLSWFKESYTVAEETIGHYSTEETLYLIGWGLLLGRWELGADLGVSGSIHDAQNFRQGPFEQQFYRATVSYCSRDLSLFDIPFGLCGGASYTQDTQTSSLADNIFVADQSKIERNSTSLKFLIRVGEDFFR